MREQCGECIPLDLLQEDQARRGLASIVLWECVKLEVVQCGSEALNGVGLLGVDVPCDQSQRGRKAPDCISKVGIERCLWGVYPLA